MLLDTYLDIETTGLAPVYSKITVIGIHLAKGSYRRGEVASPYCRGIGAGAPIYPVIAKRPAFGGTTKQSLR